MSYCLFFFSSRRRHTRYWRDWSSDVCSSDLVGLSQGPRQYRIGQQQSYGFRGRGVTVSMAERDEPTGALVRPYAVTRGRTRPRLEIALEALVETTNRGRSGANNGGTGNEHQYIAEIGRAHV